MKVNPLQWAVLLAVILFPFSVFSYHGSQGNQGNQVLAPPPYVQECMANMELYKQFFIFRGGGLTIEESRISNGFSVRIGKFIAKENNRPFDPGTAEKLDSMLVEVYDLAEEDYLNRTFYQKWGKEKMRVCVNESSPEPAPEAEPPSNRMIGI